MTTTYDKIDIEKVSFSKHYLLRASQRGISENAVKLLLRNGSYINKQGLIFFFITKKDLNYVSSLHRKELKNLIAVMGRDLTMITCYKNEHGIKNIKKKTKYLH